MIPEMYQVMTRIAEIQKRFGIIKQKNTVTENTAVQSVKQDSVELNTKKYTLDEINRIIENQAKKESIPQNLVRAVIKNESGYNQYAVSEKGAVGLMQVMPDTARAFGVDNVYDARSNITAGTRFLSYLLNKYDGDYVKSIAAYNAGETAVDKYDGIPPYKETEDYVRNVINSYNETE
ncbi:MAG: lytic transglycosylase domain-containing protein [Spirochaetes bacterium]|nr:lytic transglycosylase domain-containing protein [Spirochaetota bacterium]